MKRPSPEALLLYAVLAVAGWGFLRYLGAWNGQLDQQERAAEQQVTAALRAHAGWVDFYERARAASRADSASLVRLHRRLAVAEDSANRAQAAFDSALAGLPDAASAGDTIRVLSTAVRACTATNEQLRAAYGTMVQDTITLSQAVARWRGVADSAKAVGDSLARAITRYQQATRCRFLFLRCPSRQTVGFVAFVGGVVTGVLALR